MEEYIVSYAKENEINIYGSYNPKRFNLDVNDFYDGMHLNSNGISKVLNR